jgi:hypothetical protein
MARDQDDTASILNGPTGHRLWLMAVAFVVSLGSTTAYDLSGGVGGLVGKEQGGVSSVEMERTVTAMRKEVEAAIDQRLVRELEILREEAAEQRRRLDRVLEQLGRTQAMLELTLKQ